ncbi:hypothetical protein UY3_17242 [Chelonia mydas]|uniref:Uncharacterized protein n=1 Tax=Chelonia mydas TaxID=8469 RepID=M7B0Q3_CHEMY|nr:hypothetical protein UY3_17242 [Chelonia mydas]
MPNLEGLSQELLRIKESPYAELLTLQLKKYINDTESGQPAIKFPKSIRIFNPRRFPMMSYVKKDDTSIPGFSDISAEEFALNTRKVAPNMMQNILQSVEIDFAMFWSSIADHLPNLKMSAFITPGGILHHCTSTELISLVDPTPTPRQNN